MAMDIEQLVKQIEALTPEQKEEVCRAIVAAPQLQEEVFERKLREMGLVSQFGRKRQPHRRPHPVPARIEGKPLSQSLVEERR